MSILLLVRIGRSQFLSKSLTVTHNFFLKKKKIVIIDIVTNAV